jgi:O-antigen ligase
MLPMVAVLAARFGRGTPWQRVAGLCMVIAGVALLPLLLLIGSRMGLVAGVAAILALPFVFGDRGNRIERSRPGGSALTARRLRLLSVGVLALVCATVVALTVSWGQGFALNRLLSGAIGEDMRLRMLPTLWAMLVRNWPIGTGIGSFEKAYKVTEPDALLGPEYVNHAHNDWLELLVTTGAFGLVMLVIAAYALVAGGIRAWSARATAGPEGQLVRLGFTLIGLFALGSLGDYPLRVPSLGALFAVAVLWAGCPPAPRGALAEPEKT